MSNFTTRQEFFIPSYTMLSNEQEKIDKFLKLLEKSGVERVIKRILTHLKTKEEDHYLTLVTYCPPFYIVSHLEKDL